jgi:hypothetical protein
MSNPNKPFGFQNIGWNRGGPAVTGAQIERPIAAAYGYNICKGDVVQLSSGYVVIGAAGVAGGITTGIFLGCRYIGPAGNLVNSTYWPASNAAAGVALILPIAGVPPQLFLVQSGNSQGSYVITYADVGKNADIIVGTQTITGGYGQSGMTIDAYTVSNAPTTATYPFRIEGVYSDMAPAGYPGTDNTAVNNLVLVSSNPFNVTGY